MGQGLKVMLCPSSSGYYLNDLSEELIAQGIEVIFIPWFGKQMPYSLLRLSWSRLRGCKTLHINWMPFNRLWQLRLVARFCRTLGIRVIWTIHNLTPHILQFGSESKDAEGMRKMFMWADRGVVHSEKVREMVKRRYGGDLPLDVIHHGAPVERAKIMDPVRAREKIGVPEDAFSVLMLGPNRWNKGLRAYFQAISRLPEGYVGQVAGSCPDMEVRRLILDHCKQYPGKFVIDLRHLSGHEVSEHYAASDVLLMPFESITTSGTVVEALAHGRAVITTNLGDMHEWVHNGETGFLVDSVDDIVSRLSKLDREKARCMGKTGLALASMRTWAESAHCYAEAYRRVNGMEHVPGSPLELSSPERRE